MFSRHVLVLFAIITLASCSSLDSRIRELAPGALTIAVAPAEVQLADGTGLRFTDTGKAVQDRVINRLQDLDTATRIVKSGEPGSEDADFVLETVIRSASFEYEGISDDWWASLGLWVGTWIGGLAVGDSTYRGNVQADCRFRGRTSDVGFIQGVTSPTTSMTLLERNGFFSWATLQSVLLPPFWTTDNVETTSRALTRRSTDAIATQIASLIKNNFETTAFANRDCRLVISEPAAGNGARVTSSNVVLGMRVYTDTKVTEIELALNDSPPYAVQFQPTREGLTHVAHVKAPLQLRKGQNHVRIKIVGAVTYSRTLRFELR